MRSNLICCLQWCKTVYERTELLGWAYFKCFDHILFPGFSLAFQLINGISIAFIWEASMEPTNLTQTSAFIFHGIFKAFSSYLLFANLGRHVVISLAIFLCLLARHFAHIERLLLVLCWPLLPCICFHNFSWSANKIRNTFHASSLLLMPLGQAKHASTIQ